MQLGLQLPTLQLAEDRLPTKPAELAIMMAGDEVRC